MSTSFNTGYGQTSSYQHSNYQSWQQKETSSSLDRGVPASVLTDHREDFDDGYLVASDQRHHAPDHYTAVSNRQQPHYADNYLDANVPLPSYGTVDNDSNSLDHLIPLSGQQFVSQRPNKNYADYRGNGYPMYARSDSGSSEHGVVRQPVAPPRSSTASRQPQVHSTELSPTRASRYLPMDASSVQGSMPNGTYPGSERPVQENGHVLSTAMNTSVPVSSLHTEPQLQFVNRAYQPEPDVGNRPDSSYTTGPGYFSNNTYDPRQEDGQRSYTPNDQSPVGNASYGADTYRPTSARDYPPDNRLSDASIVYPTNDTRGNTHDASASYQAASNRPSDVSTGQTGSGTWHNPDLQEVIDFLSHPSNAVKVNAAAHLQHLSYMNDSMKGKIGYAGGIPPLVALLSHDMPEVQKAACGALRNLSYGRANDDNKRAIKNHDGLRALVRLLRQSSDNEIRELVTSILWNMSSCQDLKKPLIENTLTTLVEGVIVPLAGSSQPPQRIGNFCWSTVFRNTSGVLRNVSSEGSYSRKRLRECSGLVDSVISILKTAIGWNDIDNKSVENLVCLLRNLSYACQETIDPDYLVKRASRSQETSSTGCFGGKSKKKESSQPSDKSVNTSHNGAIHFSVENRGMQMLWHPQIVQVYQPILSDCTNPETLEAAAGALQNLSACEWQPSMELRATVRVEKCLPVLVELLSLDADGVVRSAAMALRNLAIDEHNKELIGKYAIRQLIARLPDIRAPLTYQVSDETIAAVEAAIYEVVKHNIVFAESFFNEGGVDRLIYVNVNKTRYSLRVCKFTQLLLSTLWKEFPGLHEQYTRRGFTEQQFVSPASNSKQAASVSNTMTRPQMNQGSSSYSQKTPQPVSRHAYHNAAYDTFMQPDYNSTPNNYQSHDYRQSNLPHEQVALGAVGNHDNSYQHTTAPQSSNSYAHPYDGADSRYNTASRYTPTHTMSSPAQYQVPASGPSYSSPVNAYPPADFAVAYQPASPSRDTLQEPIYSHVNRQSQSSSQVRGDQHGASQVDSWV